MTQKSSTKTKLLFLLSIAILAVGVLLDYFLVEWYEIFYKAIESKDVNAFFNAVSIFVLISLGIAFSQALWGYVSEILDMHLKTQLTSAAAVFGQKFYGTAAEGNQKLIDDAALASEKLSIVLPQMVSQITKATLMVLLMILYAPQNVFIIKANILIPFPFLISAALFTVIQLWISSKYLPFMRKVDKFKRRAENNFRLKIFKLNQLQYRSLVKHKKMYIKSIRMIRQYTAIKNLWLCLALGVVSSLSYILPFVVLFSSYFTDQISFGELMKMSAIFAFFQSSTAYIWTNARELSRGIAAYKRVIR